MNMNPSMLELTMLRVKAKRILIFCTFIRAKATVGSRIVMMTIQQAEILIVN
jgi:hypothetical protein